MACIFVCLVQSPDFFLRAFASLPPRSASDSSPFQVVHCHLIAQVRITSVSNTGKFFPGADDGDLDLDI